VRAGDGGEGYGSVRFVGHCASTQYPLALSLSEAKLAKGQRRSFLPPARSEKEWRSFDKLRTSGFPALALGLFFASSFFSRCFFSLGLFFGRRFLRSLQRFGGFGFLGGLFFGAFLGLLARLSLVRVVAADSRYPRDGRYLEQIGTYNPLLAKDDEKRVTLNEDRAKYWLGVGAQPSDRVARFLDAAGIRERAARNNPNKAEPGEKAKERAEEKAAKEAEAAEALKAAQEAPAEEEAKAEEPAAEAPAEDAGEEKAEG